MGENRPSQFSTIKRRFAADGATTVNDSNLLQTLGQVSSESASAVFRNHLRGLVRRMISDVMAEKVIELCGAKHQPSGGALYPFEDARQQLESMVKSKNPIETLVISYFYLPRLSFDLWKSLEQNETKGKTRTIARQLLERLDFAQRWGYSEIDVM